MTNPRTPRLGEMLLHIDVNAKLRPCIVTAVDSNKNEISLTSFTDENPQGTKSATHVQFDHKYSSLSASDYENGKGTPNTWIFPLDEQQARTAGAGR